MSMTIDKPVAAGASSPSPSPAITPLKVVKALASLQLTVVLFALSVLLVFFGTVAQMDNGIWTVVDQYFWSWGVWVPFELFHKMGTVFLSENFSKDAAPWSGSFPFPAGKLLGGLMLVNLLAAHALRFRFTLKRSGVLILHAGLILLFFGEFITREFAVEQRMTIDEGAAVGFTEDSRHYELAITDRSKPDTDSVVVIPASRLRDAEGVISDPQLPVDVRVNKYMRNSAITNEPLKKNPATAGLAINPKTAFPIVERPEVSGVDPEQTVDHPSAYVTLYKKGTEESLGTFLVSLWYSRAHLVNTFQLDGKPYELSLRFKRYYKSYRVELEKFRFDRYPGTQKPKNYSSDVKVFDENGALVREQTIRMNEPMRYAGETFYQQSFERSETTTILQVVRNPGWVLPYVSCTMVGVGLVLHFMIMLVGFLRKNRTVSALAAPPAPLEAPKLDEHGEPTAVAPGWYTRNMLWFVPTVVVGACVLYLGGVYGRMKPKDNFDVDMLARTPVLEGGRVKPLDTVARVYLRKISHKSDFTDEKGNEYPAIRWYLDTLGSDPNNPDEAAWQHRVIRIENDQVLHELKLPLREGLRYSWKELFEKFDDIAAKSEKIMAKKRAGKPLEPAEIKMLDLAEKMDLITKIARGAGADTEQNKFHLIPPTESGGSWTSLGLLRVKAEEKGVEHLFASMQKYVEAHTTDDELRQMVGKNADAEQIENLRKVFFRSSLADLGRLKGDASTEVRNFLRSKIPPAELQMMKSEADEIVKARIAANPGAAEWDRLIQLRKEKKYTEFNTALAEYRDKHPDAATPDEVRRIKKELNYNRFAPFLRCIGLYVIAFILSVVGFLFKAVEWPRLGESLRRSAVGVLLLAFVVHLGGLLVRMDLMNYTLVFVTNLYSSAVFIGCGCVALGLLLEKIFPIGIAAIVASVLGVATTIVAHNLATEDTLEMMQAVLDTNFWLATHVTTVTLGYTATFVAGFLGAAYAFLMFCSVIRDSFKAPGPPGPDRLLAYGAAAFGLVFLPLSVGWVLFDALAKFEVIPSILGELLRYAMVAVGGLYFILLCAARAGTENAAPQGWPSAVPRFAQPVAAMGLTPQLSKILGQMIYGVVAFATILSFIGTVLGGIWADQSWGRFWGWDPKENGAVLIVLWNALILHARWCGLVKTRGIAVLAIVGNMITAWSWFGTNQLGIGLHAYGFDTRLADGCTNFWFSMAVVAAVGLIPQRFWSTTAPAAAIPIEPPKGKKKR
jgi:ABC-type transport system involved in cytochrome c biogenesis permease subunit